MPKPLNLKLSKKRLRTEHPETLAAEFGCSVSHIVKTRSALGIEYKGPRKPGSGRAACLKLHKLDTGKTVRQNMRLLGVNPATGKPATYGWVAELLRQARGPKYPVNRDGEVVMPRKTRKRKADSISDGWL